jgi:hypothetical protein
MTVTKETAMIIRLGKATRDTHGIMMGTDQDSLSKPRPINAKWDPA